MTTRRMSHTVIGCHYLFLAAVFLLLTGPTAAQQVECGYDRTSPSIEHARMTFKSLDYACAVKELKQLIADGNITIRQKADAHALLAAVYFAELKGKKEMLKTVLGQFREVYRTYPAWDGPLDVNSPEIEAIRDEAKEQELSGHESDLPASVTMPSAGCPSSKVAWITTGVFAAASGYFLVTAMDAGDKWDKYEGDPTHPSNLYDSYKDAISLRNIAGGVTAATGVAAVYLWMRHFSAEDDCRSSQYGMSGKGGFRLCAAPGVVAVTYSF